ncbi:hypothetical protein CLV30_1044 [Haloactinopolyspora alba]|uniref:Uncharacterized protein n=1 Tax=Haloactinopolyspora alba TaxID=648780 RepID=A0A2P8E6N4_9ACTN|nr:hypothetical protein [Haloactinopolyspora alba]PSL05142.1 hypothetical protein CLV30_1044 [Haloactinopolyspora alba]
MDAFGAPRAYAADVAAQFSVRGKVRSPAAAMGTGLASGACALIGTDLLIDGLASGEQTVAYTVADALSLLVLLTVVVAGTYGLVRVAATTVRRTAACAVGGCAALALAGAIVLTQWLPGDGTRLVAFPPWAAIALGVALLVTMAALLRHFAKRGRIVGPWD